MRDKRFVVSVVAMAAILSGCATTGAQQQAWVPQIDTQGVSQATYEHDLAECRTYAEANPDADAERAAHDGAMRTGVTTAALGAGAVALTGGLALLPMAAGTIATYAGWNALFGGSGAASAADAKYKNIVASCLAGRGYHVLG